jgi:hypothetical protein
MWRIHDETLVFVERRIATFKQIAYRVMTAALVLRDHPAGNWAVNVAGVAELRRMVLLTVASGHSKRNYAKALDEIFALCALRFARCDNSRSLALF